jgi:hypothetical protein
MGPLVSDAKRDEEPLTETDIDIDLDAVLLGSGVETRPGLDPPTSPAVSAEPDDAESRAVPPPRPVTAGAAPAVKVGPPRLRAPTLVGVAPPSLAAAAPRLKPPPSTREEAEPGVPKIEVAGVPDEETTTLVGKMLAEAAAQARRKLEEKPAPASDTYQDETATKVGDAERLIATANEVFAKVAHEADTLEDATVPRVRSNGPFEETTARRDAINVDGVLARAAELKAQAEAEARRKKAAKKRTFVGLGNGPLTLPANKPALSEEIETLENAKNLSPPNLAPRPSADEETLSGVPHETPPLSPFAPHERKATMPLSGYTEPMPHGPPVRLDRSGASPAGVAHPYHDLPLGTPPGGVPPAPFAAMPASPPYANRSEPAAFAQTQMAPPPRKKRAGGVLSSSSSSPAQARGQRTGSAFRSRPRGSATRPSRRPSPPSLPSQRSSPRSRRAHPRRRP